MNEFTKYVGLDTHKETIAVAIADAGRTKPRYYGEIANTPEAIRKLVKTINPSGEVVSFWGPRDFASKYCKNLRSPRVC